MKVKCNNCGNTDHRLLLSIDTNNRGEYLKGKQYIYLCKNCGLGFTAPMFPKENYKKYYESMFGAKWAAMNISIEDLIENRKHLKIYARFFEENAEISHNSKDVKLLDIGSGLGIFSYIMREYGYNADCLEPSVTCIDFSRNKLGLTTHKGTIDKHSIDEESYDIVTNMGFIEHVLDPLSTLKDIRRIIKPNGLLYINTQDLYGMVFRNGITPQWFKAVHTYYYTMKTLKSLMQQAGFRIETTWQMPPLLKHSTYFNHKNFCTGELNIIARKVDFNPHPKYIRDDISKILEAFENAKKRDLKYYKVGSSFIIRVLKRKFSKLVLSTKMNPFDDVKIEAKSFI